MHRIEENGEVVLVAGEGIIDVKSVRPLDRYWLALEFSDGVKKTFDFSSRLEKGVFQRLADEEFFKQAHVRDGVVTWDDNLDIATETLYQEGIEM